MMRLPAFRLLRPRTLREAVDLLADDPPNTRLVAGGTDLWPKMKRGQQRASQVVSLRRVEELHGVHEHEGGGLRIGAMTTLAALIADRRIAAGHPAFHRALCSISSPALRNMGTLGGNLCLDTRCNYYDQSEEWRHAIGYCMKECGSVCWVAPGSSRCWAVNSSDTAPLLSALGAEVGLVSTDGQRRIPLADLYRDDGIDFLDKRADEILVDVHLPPAGSYEAAFWKLRRRGSIDFAVLSAAPVVWRSEEGTVQKARVYLGAVNSSPVLSREASQALQGRRLDAETIAVAARAARRVATPLDNTDYALQWRSHMVELYVEAALRELAGLPVERLAPLHTRVPSGGEG